MLRSVAPRGLVLSSLLLPSLLLPIVGCRPKPPPSPPPHPASPAAPAPHATLSGNYGGRPFVARSALLIRPNTPGRTCSSVYSDYNGCSTEEHGWDIVTSEIVIFERAVSCEHFNRNGYPDFALQPGEHSLRLHLVAPWPVYPGSIWETDDPEPTHDRISAGFWRTGSNGSVAAGHVRFLEATPDRGVVSVDLTSMAKSPDSMGSVSGSVPFSVCP